MVRVTFKTRELSDLYKYPAESSNVQSNVLVLLLVTSLLFVSCLGKYVEHDDDDFDNFVFSQRWLPSSCTEYEEKNSSLNNECVLPDKYQYWAIHGLWPNKDEGHLGPFFCNKSAHFRVDMLEPIEPQLRLYWPNIQKGHGLTSLWKHEWLKHGTCAMQVPQLGTELDYFNTSLSLYKNFNANSILTQSNVIPSDTVGYHVLDIIHIVKVSFGTAPHISCITELTSGKSYLSEIRLCFDKSLQLIDCKGTLPAEMEDEKTGFSHQLTNCPMDDLIILPLTAYSPNTKENLIRKRREARERYEKLLFLLQAIKFLM